jgi:hypothetical protein
MQYLPKWFRLACVALTACLCFAVSGSSQPYDFPPPLPSGYFLYDSANLLRIERPRYA